MDLGFGQGNQQVGQATANALLRGAQVQEQALENELKQYDRLLDDEDALEAIRQKRLRHMQQQYSQQQKWKALGHGQYTALDGSTNGSSTNVTTDIAKDFFRICKESPRVVLHFYRPSPERYEDIYHAHLSKLAISHPETKFVQLNVDGCDNKNVGGGGAAFLVERLQVRVLPTLVLVKDRKAFHHVVGFEEVGGNPHTCTTQMLAHVLGRVHGIFDLRDEEEISEEVFQQQRRGSGINSVAINKHGAKRGGYALHDDEFE